MAAAGGHEITWGALIPGLNWIEEKFAIVVEEGGHQVLQPAHHVSNAILIVLIILCLVVIARGKIKQDASSDEDLVPDGKLTVRNLLELMVQGILGIMHDSMGPVAPRFLFLIGALAFFILFSNLSGLVPGFVPPTDNLNTTAACALVVFFATHYYGFKEHGVAYLKHFVGPFWWLAWLMVPIEIISHLARPMSLSLRLFGNIMGDHKVGAIFFMLAPLAVPVFTMVLGLFVSFVQTFVFMLLSMVYISGAIEHAEH
ncbi:MAG: F0F1 ATP synthase subunit A [Deferrisomatales bacterium]